MASSDETPSGAQDRVRVIMDDLRLLPVIEIEPFAFGAAPRLGTGPLTVEERESYWRECLQEGGLIGVDPIAPGEWLVSLDALESPESLHRVLQAHFADGVPADPDEISVLCGGFALADGAEILVLPSCCGDLGNLDDWQNAAQRRTESPEMLWIGHPWLTAWYQAPMLHIREETEYNTPAHPREFAMSPGVLQNAVHQATRDLDLFYERVVASLRDLPGVSDALATGKILVGRRYS